MCFLFEFCGGIVLVKPLFLQLRQVVTNPLIHSLNVLLSGFNIPMPYNQSHRSDERLGVS